MLSCPVVSVLGRKGEIEMSTLRFASIIPPEDAIPEKLRILSPIKQRQYLCDGAFKEWTGPQQDVLSPLCEATPDGVQRKIIGSYPLLGEQQALEALDAA